MTKHRWHDVLIAIAEGKQAEYAYPNEGKYYEAGLNERNPLTDDDLIWRIKKEPVIEVKYFYKDGINYGDYVYAEFTPDLENWDLKITYQDGKAIKAELPE